jgi:hypothetical protein
MQHPSKTDQRVRATPRNRGWVGTGKGTVTSIVSDERICVTWDNGTTETYYPNELQIITERK